MEKEPAASKLNIEPLSELDLHLDDMRKYGIASDLFNQFSGISPMKPRMLNLFVERGKEGQLKTYSEKYKDQPEILKASDPEKVKKLDSFVEKIKEAVSDNDLHAIKKLLIEFLLYWNELGFENVKDEQAKVLKEELENIGE